MKSASSFFNLTLAASVVLAFFLVSLPLPMSAETPAGTTAKASTDTVAESPQARTLPNPLGTSDVREVIARIINIMTAISGSIALLMFVYGGVLWMVSGGSSEKVEAGKKAVVWATIGLFIIFGSYAILRVIFQAFGARL